MANANNIQITEIRLPSSVTEIGNESFYGLSSLQTINLSDGLTSIGSAAFYDCGELSLSSLPDSVTSIGMYAFHDCNKLQLSSLPPNLTKIEEATFNYCRSLALSSLPSGIVAIDPGAFAVCDNLSLTRLPSGLKSIGEAAFSSCYSLALSSLPEGIESIGPQAFSQCSNISFTSLPSLYSIIDSYDFYGCTHLALSSLPENIKSIGFRAFSDCTNLSITTIPSSVERIEYYAFRNCTKLTDIVFEGIPSSLANNAFHNCSSISSIICPWYDGEVAGAPWGATNAVITYLAPIIEPAKLVGTPPNDEIWYSSSYKLNTNADSGSNLSSHTFENGKGILKFNSNIQWFDELYGLFNTDSAHKGLVDVRLPSSMTELVNTFTGCSSLVSASLPANIKSIHLNSFKGCSSLSNVEFNCVPMHIDSYAFSNCPNLTHLEVPWESGLVTLAPWGATNATIEYADSFSPAIDVSELTPAEDEISYNSYFEIYPEKESAYTGIITSVFANKVGTFKFNESLSSIDKGIFSEEPVISVKIPSSVVSIGSSAFNCCYYLSSINLPNGLSSIEYYAFTGCHLTNIDLPSSLVNIGAYAFEGCPLKSIEFTAASANIAVNAFNYCSALTSIVCPWYDGEVAGAPWGATNAVITYLSEPHEIPDDPNKPDDSKLFFHMPFTSSSQLHETVSGKDMADFKNGSGTLSYTTVGNRDCVSTPYTADKTTSFQIIYPDFNTTDPTSSNFVDVSGSFTLAGWIRPKSSSVNTWYTFMSLGDYSGSVAKDLDETTGITTIKVLNLMIMNSNKIGGGSESVNLGVNNEYTATGDYAYNNTYSQNVWHLLVLTYDAPTKTIDIWMNIEANAVSMTHIAHAENIQLSIDPSTDLTLYIGFIKNKRQFRSQYIRNVKMWNYKLEENNINWLYAND